MRGLRMILIAVSAAAASVPAWAQVEVKSAWVRGTVGAGEFIFAAAYLEHGHIYGQCNGLLEAGADCVRVNCAHDEPATWMKMIRNVRAAASADRALITQVGVFDVFTGKGVPEGKKSLAIEVTLQPREKTLTDSEIDAVAAKIVAAVAKATGGELRT